MAGYLFNLDSISALNNALLSGVFSTRLSNPDNMWRSHHEGTFADYSSMKVGDNVYFFIQRKIYGIGEIVSINDQCVFLNYPSANKPENFDYDEIRHAILFNREFEDSLSNRFIFVFKPSPYFFRLGVDMDDLLLSSPSDFRMLRAFWKLSFLKFPDAENQAFKNLILRRNSAYLDGNNVNYFESDYTSNHEMIRGATHQNDDYQFSAEPLLTTTCNTDGSIRHEMAIEAAIIHQLNNDVYQTIETFGRWDYLSHQVIASPFKPIDYMDKMDIFGYRYIHDHKPTIDKYLVIEIKKGTVYEADILQLMKYVDWISNEYAYGDYGMITSFIVGHSFEETALTTFHHLAERKYILGVRPAQSNTWVDVKLIRYSFDNQSNTLVFTPAE